MKYFKILIISVLLLAALSISCERDDICPASTPTTPHLIIDFLDVNNNDNPKNVFGLLIIDTLTTDTLLVTDLNIKSILPGYGFISESTILLPLKTDANTTQFVLFKEAEINDNGTEEDTSDDFIEGNPDVITINYSREQVFVSRACGYKTIFKNVTLTIEPDEDNWMLSRQPLTDNQSVEDETTTHFNITH
ncbi:DUF6452 family protein [Tamlana crocina]|uniref:Lipoprotein n=1 Tax=Tamlana crocina TaxID=393006 RepID=A0ABX1DB33_9FLAO|nr:DUF6452 family protein [Tamlana crocina]NJX15470.1 hypothetical protein [Tamlana crocina]